MLGRRESVTNLEWIRQADREELVRFIERLVGSDGCYECEIGKTCREPECIDGINDFLDREHDPDWYDKYPTWGAPKE